jgi:hypothetical protein
LSRCAPSLPSATPRVTLAGWWPSRVSLLGTEQVCIALVGKHCILRPRGEGRGGDTPATFFTRPRRSLRSHVSAAVYRSFLCVTLNTRDPPQCSETSPGSAYDRNKIYELESKVAIISFIIDVHGSGTPVAVLSKNISNRIHASSAGVPGQPRAHTRHVVCGSKGLGQRCAAVIMDFLSRLSIRSQEQQLTMRDRMCLVTR